MEDIAGFPFFPVQYDKTGAAHVQSEEASLLAFLGQATTTDLILISHGWNNDMKEAMDLYRRLLTSIRAELTADATLAARKFAVVGILWPSKKS